VLRKDELTRERLEFTLRGRHPGSVVTGNAAIVLLVDDDEAKRYLMGTWLRRAGHTVIEAGTGREALEKAGSAELVLLDVNLPDMLGYDVCRQIKADPATAAIPVIQISATAVQVSDRARGLTQGADAYLTDPNEPEELLAVVLAALRYSRARQRAERTASLLAGLTSVALDINAADTFDGLARAAAAGAARIFAAHAVLILEMPDGQIRRTSASPDRPEPRQRGAPAVSPIRSRRGSWRRARPAGRSRSPARTGWRWSRTARCNATSARPRSGRNRAVRRWRWRSTGPACPATRSCRSCASWCSWSRWPPRRCAPTPRSTSSR
jgi:Response regulators consisting of a CheY-like receiver domain and a winged-helix DNA-binding domain